jgi:hypothetical protein
MKVRTLSSLAAAMVLATRALPQVTTAADGEREAGAGGLASPASYRVTVAQAPVLAVPAAAEPVPAPPGAIDRPDLSAFDRVAVEAPAMAAYRVVEHPVPRFRSRDLYTEDGMAALSFKAHPGLHFGDAFNVNRKAAYEMFMEDDWRATKSDYWDIAHAMAQGGDRGEGRMILEEVNDEDLRMRGEAEGDAAAPAIGRFQIASAESGTRLLELPEQSINIPLFRRAW